MEIFSQAPHMMPTEQKPLSGNILSTIKRSLGNIRQRPMKH